MFSFKSNSFNVSCSWKVCDGNLVKVERQALKTEILQRFIIFWDFGTDLSSMLLVQIYWRFKFTVWQTVKKVYIHLKLCWREVHRNKTYTKLNYCRHMNRMVKHPKHYAQGTSNKTHELIFEIVKIIRFSNSFLKHVYESKYTEWVWCKKSTLHLRVWF